LVKRISDGKDPDGRYARRVALLNKVASVDNDIVAAVAYVPPVSGRVTLSDGRAVAAAPKLDNAGLLDLKLLQVDLQRQANLLPST